KDSGILLNEEDKIIEFFDRAMEFHPTKNQNIKNGEFADGSLDKFISRFESKINDKRLKFLFGAEAKNISFVDTIRNFIGYEKKNESNVTIIDLSGVPFEVLSITVSLISRLL